MRRAQKRMQVVGIKDFGDYLDYLEVHPEEFVLLFNTILINVTSFFRDPTAWDFLVREGIPPILTAKAKDEAVRVWSAGCATGEEAYTLAILMAETMGVDAFKQRVKIYATDMDEDALVQARQATYTAKEIEPIPPELRDKYFEQIGTRYVFRGDLRRSVIFGRHDLIQDAPISRVDILACRNTLMYFNAETQARILARFHFALNEKGCLFLGKAELMLSNGELYNALNLKQRVFSKIPKASLRDRLLVLAQGGSVEAGNQLGNQVQLRELAFDTAPVAQAIIDLNGNLAMMNERARRLFNLNSRDVGRRFQDLEFSSKPVEIHAMIQRAYAEQEAVVLRDVERNFPDGESHFLDVVVTPLTENSSVIGVSVTFNDASRYQQIKDELQRSAEELETAYEELQSSNEELETTNEELQSTVEELETTNEELHSSNEELETMNEELQSTNEELNAMNAQLRSSTQESKRVNSFLESILFSMRTGVVVLNSDFQTQVWNRKSEDLWGVRSEEVRGKNFLNLDIGLPVQKLTQPIRSCLNGEAEEVELVLDCTNRRGKPIKCAVTCIPLTGSDGARGVILCVEEAGGSR
jgi:two-component system CheB/CheR fusion protein